MLGVLLVSTSPFQASAKDNGRGKSEAAHSAVAKVDKPGKPIVKQNNDRKGDGDNDDDDRSHIATNTPPIVTGNNDQNHCFMAFGHFIAPGWIKTHGQNDPGFQCDLNRWPFGIRWNFWGNHQGTGTTTVPMTAPVLSNLSATAIAQNTVTISWNTDKYSDSRVWIASTSPVDTSGTPAGSQSALLKNHIVGLSGLTASTTYYVIATSRDGYGKIGTSSQLSFTTASVPVVLPLISGITAPTVGSTTATVNWTTNVNVDSKIFYSTTTPVVIGAGGTLTATSSTLTTNHSLDLSGLATSTIYYFLVQSTDGLSNIVTGNQSSFMTLDN